MAKSSPSSRSATGSSSKGRSRTNDAPTENILTLIHILSNRITRAFSVKVEPKFGISLPEWRVIMTLAWHETSTANDIIAIWSLDKMTANRAIRKLEAAELVLRRRSTVDRRRFDLSLTPEGRRLYDKIVPAANDRYQEIVSVLSRDDLHVLGDRLSKLLRQAENINQDK
jgi:DNA-binding MarR family transcriptional regulator